MAAGGAITCSWPTLGVGLAESPLLLQKGEDCHEELVAVIQSQGFDVPLVSGCRSRSGSNSPARGDAFVVDPLESRPDMVDNHSCGAKHGNRGRIIRRDSRA